MSLIKASELSHGPSIMNTPTSVSTRECENLHRGPLHNFFFSFHKRFWVSSFVKERKRCFCFTSPCTETSSGITVQSKPSPWQSATKARCAQIRRTLPESQRQSLLCFRNHNSQDPPELPCLGLQMRIATLNRCLCLLPSSQQSLNIQSKHDQLYSMKIFGEGPKRFFLSTFMKSRRARVMSLLGNLKRLDM